MFSLIYVAASVLTVHGQNYGGGTVGDIATAQSLSSDSLLRLCTIVTAPYQAIAILSGNGNVTGTVRINQASAGQPTTYSGIITGLAPNSQHGIHVHWYGDISNGCTKGGVHFNPTNMAHGDIEDSRLSRHVGDLGNVQADASGVVTLSVTDRISQLAGPGSIIGRLFVIHQNKDDLGKGGDAGSIANGNSGAPLACGVIGYREPLLTPGPIFPGPFLPDPLL